MKILYLSGSYVPSRRASSVQVMKMCAALASLGHRVSLVVKRCASREEPGEDDPFAFYGVPAAFELERLPRPAFKGGGLLYLQAIRRRLDRRHGDTDLIYARDLWGGAAAATRGFSLVLEAHGIPTGRLGVSAYRRIAAAPGLRRIVFISDALRRLFEERDLLDSTVPWMVAHDGADPPSAGDEASPPAALGQPEDGRFRVGYVGHLYRGRGVEIMLRLAELHPDCEFHLIGGSGDDLEQWRAQGLPKNLLLHGFLPPARLPGCYAHLDVLLMPYQRNVLVAGGRTDTSSWMSPMKMFEYMAAGRAIISSDLPVLREVLENERNALLVPPDDPTAWSAALHRLQHDPGLRQRLGESAHQDLLARYTWRQRARRILEGL